jgi:hypothetical protein
VTRIKYYIDKICTKMGGWKIAKEPNEKKKGSLKHIIGPKFKNWVVQKIIGLKKPN